MKNKTILLITLSIIAILGIGLVAAFLGKGMTHLYGEEKSEIMAFKISIQEAIENEDFVSWKTLMESQLTQEKFDELVEKQNQFSEQVELKEQMMQDWEHGDYETMTQFKEGMHKDYTGEFTGHEEYFQEKEGFFHMFKFWKR